MTEPILGPQSRPYLISVLLNMKYELEDKMVSFHKTQSFVCVCAVNVLGSENNIHKSMS